MENLTFIDDKLIYADQGKTKVLLDFNDFLLNKSRVSLHRLQGETHPIWTDFIFRLLKKVKSNAPEMVLPVFMIDTLLSTRLIRTSQPVHVLEYGCQDGLLSSYIAELLGAFHNESLLVCAYNTINFNSIAWMEHIADIEVPPKLSYFAGDYGHLQLEKHYFDIIIINGSENFMDPCQVIQDALELLTEDGILLCYTDDAPLLESTFKLYFEKREEYNISPIQKVLVAQTKDGIWKAEEKNDFTTEAQQHLDKAQDILLSHFQNQSEILKLVEALQHDCKIAATQGKIDWKIRLLHQKEQLISYLIALK